ncbi:bacterioferritin-associated ferredoxin [Pendulispora rubella]|uniref:(2Fe-2S)-binding protein n=1 Tax=Pendulispora rubella TaxID=2741070 RepID=UPI00374DFCAB
MFVCICNAVTESEVRAAIHEGARSREEVTQACQAGGDCGSCHHMIEDMVEEHEELISAASLVRAPCAA